MRFFCDIEDMSPGDHSCLIYDRDEERRRVVSAFVRMGLKMGDKVVCIADICDPEGIRVCLEDLDIKPFIDGGLLSVLSWEAWEEACSASVPGGLHAFPSGKAEVARASVSRGLWLTFEMTGVLRGRLGIEAIDEHESRLQSLCKRDGCIALCQYDRRRIEASVILEALKAHPLTIDGCAAVDNIYYMPASDRGNREEAALDAALSGIGKYAGSLRAARASEEKLRQIFDSSAIGIAIIDPGAGFLSCNEALKEIFGTREEDLALPSPGTCWSRLIEIGRAVQSGGDRSQMEARCRRKDGAEICVSINASIIKGLGREPGLIICLVEDVTERVKMAEALAWESEVNSALAEISCAITVPETVEEISDRILEHAKGLTESALGFVGYIDPESGSFICTNMTGEDRHGNEGNADHISSNGFSDNGCNVNEGGRNGGDTDPRRHLELTNFDKLWGWVLDNKKPLLTNDPSSDPRSGGLPAGHIPIQRFLSVPAVIDGKLVGQITLANSIRDYTDKDLALLERLAGKYALVLHRRWTDKALKESESKYKEIIENTRDLIYSCSIDGNINFVSPNVSAWGYSPDEVIGHDMSGFIHPEDLALVLGNLELAAKNEEPHPTIFRLRASDGSFRYVEEYSKITVDEGIPVRITGVIRDITERKQMEDALWQANERLDMAQRASGTGVWDWNVITGRIEWSPELFDLFGVDPEKAVASFDSWNSVLHYEDRIIANSRIEEALREHTSLDSEYRIMRPDGQIRWINSLGHGIYDDQSRPIRMIGICIDITGRRRAEEMVRESEVRFRGIFESSPIGIEFYDQNGNLVSVNKSCLELFGVMDEGELEGFNLFDDPNISEGIKKRLRQGEMVRYEVPFDFEKVRENKLYDTWREGIIHLDVLITPLGLGETRVLSGYLVQVQDITERKRAMDEIESLAKFPEENPNPVLRVSQDGVVSYANRSSAPLIGSWDCQVGQRLPDPWRGIILKAFMSREMDKIDALCGSITYSLVIAPIEGTDYINIYGADVTERKRAEEELCHTRQQLTDIIEFLPDATFVIDREGRVIAWNRAMEDMTGVCKKDMIGLGDHAYTVPFYGERRKQLLDLLDADDAEIASKYNYVKRKGETLCAEVFTPALYGGRGAYVWAIGAPIFDAQGNRAGAIESIRDITSRKRAEDALRESEERFRRMADNIQDGLVIRECGRVVYLNKRAVDILGFSREELMNMKARDLAAPEERERLDDIRESLMRGEEPLDELEYWIVRKDGSLGEVATRRLCDLSFSYLNINVNWVPTSLLETSMLP